MPQPLDAVTHSELVFGVGSGANTDSKFSRNSANCSFDPQQVTQISVLRSSKERVRRIRGWTEVTAPDQAIFSFIDSSFEFSKFGDPESGGNGRLI